MIELNKVGVEIDGKVYEMRKMSLGFQRRMVELQSNLSELRKKYEKKYGVTGSELDNKLTEDEKLTVSKMSVSIQGVIAGLFVNPDDAAILDQFSEDNVRELIAELS